MDGTPDEQGKRLAGVEGKLDPSAGGFARIKTKLDAAINRGDDHETRIRKLERLRYGWPASIVVAVVSAIAAVATAVMKSH